MKKKIGPHTSRLTLNKDPAARVEKKMCDEKRKILMFYKVLIFKTFFLGEKLIFERFLSHIFFWKPNPFFLREHFELLRVARVYKGH